MTEQVACTECGALVSASTARRMKGLCIPSKRTTADRFHVFYNSLIDRVHRTPGGFDTLAEAEKLYFAVILLRNEVYNGGFHQYFFNSSGSYYNQAENGLIAVGAMHTLELLREARDILFPTMPAPVDTEMRRQVIPVAEPGAPTPEWADKLDKLDKRFYADSDNLTSRMKAFAREQGLVAGQQDTDR